MRKTDSPHNSPNVIVTTSQCLSLAYRRSLSFSRLPSFLVYQYIIQRSGTECKIHGRITSTVLLHLCSTLPIVHDEEGKGFTTCSCSHLPSTLSKPRPLVATPRQLVGCKLKERQLTGFLSLSDNGAGCLNDHVEGKFSHAAELFLLGGHASSDGIQENVDIHHVLRATEKSVTNTILLPQKFSRSLETFLVNSWFM